jgi:tetratricopeptide (TPR) repeat protein
MHWLERKWPLLLFGLAALFALLYFGPDLAAWNHEQGLRRMELPILEERVKSQPGDAAAHYQLGLRYAQADRHIEATRELLAALREDPGRAEVLNDLGVSYLLQERYKESQLALEGALQAKPRYERAKANLGRLRLATRMPFSAIKEFNSALRWAPDDYVTWSDLGQAHQETQQYVEAEAAFRSAIRLNPAFHQAWIGLGQVLSVTGKPIQAEQAFRKAVIVSKDDPAALAALGRQLIENGVQDPIECRTVLESAVRKIPSNAEVQYDLGRLALSTRDWSGAEGLFTHALSLSPEHMGAMTQIQKALLMQGKEPAANQWAERLRQSALRSREVRRLEAQIARSPSDWNSRSRLAELYVDQGRFGLANMLLSELQQGSPQIPGAERARKHFVASLMRRNRSGAVVPSTRSSVDFKTP